MEKFMEINLSHEQVLKIRENLINDTLIWKNSLKDLLHVDGYEFLNNDDIIDKIIEHVNILKEFKIKKRMLSSLWAESVK